jgi:hypothetical protein
MLLTPEASSTAAEEAGGLFVEGSAGDDAELRALQDRLGVALLDIELVHVPRIRDGAEKLPSALECCSHLREADQESLGGLRVHRLLPEPERVVWRRLSARRTRQASSRSQSVAVFSQECSDRAQAWLRIIVGDWLGLTYCAASSGVSRRPVCLRTSAIFIGFMGFFLQERDCP